MSRLVHMREKISGPFTPDHLARRIAEGWRLAAVEWERQAEAEVGPASLEEAPYGLRVAGDCSHLEEDPTEVEALTPMMEGITQDLPLGRIAQNLNASGFKTRTGSTWTQQAVFNMLPRLIEAGPRILTSRGWPERRQKLHAG